MVNRSRDTYENLGTPQGFYEDTRLNPVLVRERGDIRGGVDDPFLFFNPVLRGGSEREYLST